MLKVAFTVCFITINDARDSTSIWRSETERKKRGGGDRKISGKGGGGEGERKRK